MLFTIYSCSPALKTRNDCVSVGERSSIFLDAAVVGKVQLHKARQLGLAELCRQPSRTGRGPFAAALGQGGFPGSLRQFCHGAQETCPGQHRGRSHGQIAFRLGLLLHNALWEAFGKLPHVY